MGKGYTLTCYNCNYTFEYLEGIGFDNTIYHCNSCGKQKAVKNESINFKTQCKCGGIFKKKSPKICPKCHQKIDMRKIKDRLLIMWD